ASASIEPVRAVESLRSVKTSVTNLRTSDGGRTAGVVAGRVGAGARRLPNELGSPTARLVSDAPASCPGAATRCAGWIGGDADEPRASAAAQEDGMAAGDDATASEALRASGLFGAADAAAIDALVRVLRIRRFRRGETIFHQGDPGDALFVLASGSVKVVLPSDEGAEPAIVAILGAGEFFGELAILDGAPHSATIVAVEATETLVLHRDAFLDLIDRDAGLRRALLASLAAEIRRLTGHVED